MLSSQDLVPLIQKALKTAVSAEKDFLEKVFKEKYQPITMIYLWKSPAFITTLKQTHPDHQYFQIIEDCLFSDPATLHAYQRTLPTLLESFSEVLSQEYETKKAKTAPDETSLFLKYKQTPVQEISFLQAIARLQTQGVLGSAVIKIIIALEEGSKTWNPYWINSELKLKKILTAINTLPADNDFSSEMADKNSSLYQAVYWQRVPQISIFNSSNTKSANPLAELTTYSP